MGFIITMTKTTILGNMRIPWEATALRYGGGRTRGRKRGGQQVQQMATLQAAVHGMCNLAHLLAQKGGGKAAYGRTLFVSRGEQVSAEEEWQEYAGELGDAGGGFV